MFNNIVIYYTIFFEFGARRPQRTSVEKYPKITGEVLIFSRSYQQTSKALYVNLLFSQKHILEKNSVLV